MTTAFVSYRNLENNPYTTWGYDQREYEQMHKKAIGKTLTSSKKEAVFVPWSKLVCPALATDPVTDPAIDPATYPAIDSSKSNVEKLEVKLEVKEVQTQLHPLFKKISKYQPSIDIKNRTVTSELKTEFLHEIKHDSDEESWKLVVYFPWLPKKNFDHEFTHKSTQKVNLGNSTDAKHLKVETWYNQHTASTRILMMQGMSLGTHRITSKINRKFATES